jgi:molybdopterin/thiamine biosynthesis adenylyltransferase
MDFSRIASAIDVESTQRARVTIVGTGASAGLIQHLARCGVRDFVLLDPDRVGPENLPRQEHYADCIGRLKVEAVADMLRRVQPDMHVTPLAVDFLAMTDREVDRLLGQTDLFLFATDRFAAQARGNEVTLRLSKPALWVGLYPGGLAGEIIFWHPGIAACYRCLCAKRYANHAKAAAEGRSLDPASDGCTILDINLLDNIAGMLAVGLLTRGSATRYGRLIEALGNRNFLQVQLSPEWRFNDRDLVRELLGIAGDCSAYFAWNTVVRSDPDRGQLPCPDCERFRSHEFFAVDGKPCRSWLSPQPLH